MKVVIREEVDLDDIFTWISKDNPRAAIGVVERIRLRINHLTLPPLASLLTPR